MTEEFEPEIYAGMTDEYQGKRCGHSAFFVKPARNSPTVAWMDRGFGAKSGRAREVTLDEANELLGKNYRFTAKAMAMLRELNTAQ